MAAQVGPSGLVVHTDINAAMLSNAAIVCWIKAWWALYGGHWPMPNACHLPIKALIGVTIGFGLRNVTDKSKLAIDVSRAQAGSTIADSGIFTSHRAGTEAALRLVFVQRAAQSSAKSLPKTKPAIAI